MNPEANYSEDALERIAQIHNISYIYLYLICKTTLKLDWKKRKNSICKSCSSVSPHSNRKCFYLFWEFITNCFTWSCSRNKLSLKTKEEEGSKVSGGKACCSKSFPWRPQFCIYEFREGQKELSLLDQKKKRCVHCQKTKDQPNTLFPLTSLGRPEL